MVDFESIEAITSLPTELGTFLVAMTPIGELRAAIPFGLHFGMSVITTYIISVLGNMVPVFFILKWIDPISKFLRKRSKLADKFFEWLFARTRKKFGKSYEKWEHWALVMFVAIPLPVTGAWTGSFAAYLFGIPSKKAFGLITLGVMIAGVIVTLISKGVLSFF